MLQDSPIYLCAHKIAEKYLNANDYNQIVLELSDYIPPRHLRQITVPLY